MTTIRTDNYNETIRFLMQRARGKTENKDNRFFIDSIGRIVAHGYIQSESNAYFPQTPRNSIEITISKATALHEGHPMKNELLKSIIEAKVIDAMKLAQEEERRDSIIHE